ncbi:DUF3810 domain-containing protein [Algibacter pacificus]|uniref:DUF3810 domain-containing protein n=1 Tax=Algibacter pacificus TaxID=2599389 RepID=UPI0011C89B18|nr:DUF3810 domain-containing protein [Algibacter pacificus]
MLKEKKTIIALLLIPQYFFVKFLADYPEFVEAYYSNGLYVYVSKMFRFCLGWLPFSFGDLVYAVGLIYIIRWFFKNWKRLKTDTKQWFVDVFSAVSVLYFAFHLFWGVNYYRLPLHKSLNLNAEYSTEQLVKVTEQLILKANALHLEIAKNDTVKVDVPLSKHDILKLAPDGYLGLKQVFPDLEYSPQSVKKSLFSYPLTYMGFSGYLNPLTNEAQVDGLIPKFKFATTTTHEIAHQLGFAAENEANFIGCLAAINHDNIYFKYCGYTFGLRYCLNEIYRRDEAQYEALSKTINIGILKNYQEVRLFWEAHQNPTEPLFKSFYNGFLKANKQTKGMKSYSYVVALLVNYFE